MVEFSSILRGRAGFGLPIIILSLIVISIVSLTIFNSLYVTFRLAQNLSSHYEYLNAGICYGIFKAIQGAASGNYSLSINSITVNVNLVKSGTAYTIAATYGNKSITVQYTGYIASWI
ncbi:MAG: hypothetical protein PHX20_03535 [Candidatus Omnitrophica bacterium]|nr:hypothetical protein [Candidatus Omnitrophota bacterium]MDD5436596.1 hypothetical protein [Candidatus Omnitrophota bacterium]